MKILIAITVVFAITVVVTVVIRERNLRPSSTLDTSNFENSLNNWAAISTGKQDISFSKEGRNNSNCLRVIVSPNALGGGVTKRWEKWDSTKYQYFTIDAWIRSETDGAVLLLCEPSLEDPYKKANEDPLSFRTEIITSTKWQKASLSGNIHNSANINIFIISATKDDQKHVIYIDDITVTSP